MIFDCFRIRGKDASGEYHLVVRGEADADQTMRICLQPNVGSQEKYDAATAWTSGRLAESENATHRIRTRYFFLRAANLSAMLASCTLG